MSFSLHSSTEYLGGSNRWSRNDSDMVPEKSSIGTDLLEDLLETRLAQVRSGVLASVLATAGTPALVAEQPVERLGLQGEEVGNLEGSRIFANETRRGGMVLDECSSS